MSAARYLRKLILGETWALPLGLAVAVVVTAALERAAGTMSWWPALGGFVLLALVVVALTASLFGALGRRD